MSVVEASMRDIADDLAERHQHDLHCYHLIRCWWELEGNENGSDGGDGGDWKILSIVVGS
jgi:hypothetical protein